MGKPQEIQKAAAKEMRQMEGPMYEKKLTMYSLPEHCIKVPSLYKCPGSGVIIYRGVLNQGTSGVDLKT